MLAVIGTGGAAEVAQVSIPRRPERWLRLRVLLAALCRTDVQAATGQLAIGRRRILGHEMVGEVIESDPGCRYGPGARVAVALPLVACAACTACATGARCPETFMLGVDVDGAFAEQVVVPETAVCPVPESLPLRRAACVEPLAATSAVLRAPIQPEERGAVLGAGRIAEMTTRVLRAHGFATVDTGPDLAGGYDFVVEAAGTATDLDRALRLVRPGGVVVLKSRPAKTLTVDVTRAVRNDITLAAVSYGSFDEAVRLAGELPIDDLLGPIRPLAEFSDALAAAQRDPQGPKLFLEPVPAG
ncbi:alcohol dehydrogenase catalytic domain-containing protein [Nocardia sp. NPDC051750]|uniref:alcohol dehydrogenase catalytic domain-containing protein n=1 Tax=Nocardia sp. NPDC051750 TaxID=3364325 RepID=UPI0037AF74C3